LEGSSKHAIAVVVELYTKLLKLEESDLNGIWANIIKNAFQPLFRQHSFDYVVGNSPWVNWESLPENYRRQTEFLWEGISSFLA